MTGIIDKMMSEIKVTPLLGVQDFNRSSTLVKIGGKNVLLDCGLNLSPSEEKIISNGHHENGGKDLGDSLLPNFSCLIGSEFVHTSIDCVIISHYHLDHSGALPYLTEMIGYKGPIYMTQPTKTIAPFVWRDCQKFLREKKFFPDFLTSSKINDCLSKVTTVCYSEVISVDNDMTVTVYPSNQPLGPDIFRIEVGPQTICYTGGCNLKPYSKQSSSSLLPNPLHSKAKDSHMNSSAEIASTSSPSSDQQQGDLCIKMNGCMLSFKIGHSVLHQQLSSQEIQLVTAVFNNLQYMNETNEDEFWQRVSYEMTAFSSPLAPSSKLKWKTLFYESLRSCGKKLADNLENASRSNNGQDNGAIGYEAQPSVSKKKKRKNKKAEAKNNVHWSSTSIGDLIKFESPEKEAPYTVELPKKTKNKSKSNGNIITNHTPSPRPYTPDPVIVDEQHLLISLFAERLKTNQISPEFWIVLSRDLKRKGKITKSTDFLEEYFKKLANIQLEIMKSSENANQAREKWPHFDLLNEIDLSYFFQDKWGYRNEKKHFIVTSTNPNKSTKTKKTKQKQLKLQESDYQQFNHQSDHEITSPTNGNNIYENRNSHPQQRHQDEVIEPKQIRCYKTPPEDLADQLITINLFANRLNKTEISPEFWDLLHKDFEDIGKPIKPEIDLRDHYKELAEIQLDVMKNADNMITALKLWPLFMILHDLPLDIFLEDKWSYRRLKPRFC